MRRSLFWLVSGCCGVVLFFSCSAEASFTDHFTDRTMRVDYRHTGDAKVETITLDTISRGGIWAGSMTHLIDPFGNGRYAVHVEDPATGELLFSKGFDSLFGEYQSTDEALKGQRRSFPESVLIPNPKEKVRVVLLKKNRRNMLIKIFETVVDPANVAIIDESAADPDVRVVQSHVSGDPHVKVDVVVLGEGYTKAELGTFKRDLKAFTDIFLAQEPYASNKDAFNISGVFKASAESGTDEPTAGIFKRTALNTSFNTFGSERYLMTEDNKAMRDLASHVPYDAISIMVNHGRYGGGGIYNQYSVFTQNALWKAYLIIHEFGHLFGGLADEYYTSENNFNDLYPRGVEPSEPNITALLDRKNLKWKGLLTEGADIPTPWEKEGYEKMDLPWQALRRSMVRHIDDLKKARASAEEIEKAENEYNAKDVAHNQEVHGFFSRSKYRDVVGAFEGAGYAAKGLYRPMLDCIMFSKGRQPFCRVCLEALKRMIASYSS